jgi:lysophospholipase L1-like esterase
MQYNRRSLTAFDLSRKNHPGWPVLVSEGDSWFSYSRVTQFLDEDKRTPNGQRQWCFLRLEKNGDEILTILSGGQKQLLREVFKRSPIDALLFSGGGNDIIGADLLPLLKPYVQGAGPADLIDHRRFDRRIRQIRDCYLELIDLVQDSGQHTRLFVNSYDYVVPSNKPVRLLGLVKVAGPWMIGHFKERNIPVALRAPIIRILIDRFVAMIDSLPGEQGVQLPVIRVNTLNIVGNDWKDEIHPSRKGARRVAEAFRSAMVAERLITS